MFLTFETEGSDVFMTGDGGRGHELQLTLIPLIGGQRNIRKKRKWKLLACQLWTRILPIDRMNVGRFSEKIMTCDLFVNGTFFVKG